MSRDSAPPPGVYHMAKKGREARITRTIAKIRGDALSLALQRALSRPRARSSLEEEAPKRSSWRRRKTAREFEPRRAGDADAPHGYHGGARLLVGGEHDVRAGADDAVRRDGSGVVATTDARRETGREQRRTKTCARRSRRAVGRSRTR